MLAALVLLAGCDLLFPYESTTGHAQPLVADGSSFDGETSDRGRDAPPTPRDGRVEEVPLSDVGVGVDGKGFLEAGVILDAAADSGAADTCGGCFVDGPDLLDAGVILDAANTCGGCFDEAGACRPGDDTAACGSAGSACVACDPSIYEVCESWGCSTEK